MCECPCDLISVVVVKLGRAWGLFVFVKLQRSTPPITAVQALVGRLSEVQFVNRRKSFLEDLLCHVTVDPLDPVIWSVPEGTGEGNFYVYFLLRAQCFLFFAPKLGVCVWWYNQCCNTQWWTII